MPWLRLWTDIFDSPVISSLDDNTYRGWTVILLATKRFGHGGVVPPVRQIAFWARRSRDEVTRWIEALIAENLLRRNDEVIIVPDWDRWDSPYRSPWQVVRRRIFARDGYRCAYCGTTDGPFHCDHVIPRSRGGSDEEDNLVVACRRCNLSKNDRTPDEWRS